MHTFRVEGKQPQREILSTVYPQWPASIGCEATQVALCPLLHPHTLLPIPHHLCISVEARREQQELAGRRREGGLLDAALAQQDLQPVTAGGGGGKRGAVGGWGKARFAER